MPIYMKCVVVVALKETKNVGTRLQMTFCVGVGIFLSFFYNITSYTFILGQSKCSFLAYLGTYGGRLVSKLHIPPSQKEKVPKFYLGTY